ncbi:hypothetical protein [Micromonospora sp. NBS 11-29]|uniref:hypothetical protein n=1 Tax=Micromonospora sp. NBS 11-29 TaxID=1960879 RepID=UPI0020CE255D|nr:hypothetical protein [Micromonospora sp. NBS 11-29]
MTHTRADVAAELADVAFTALVAIESLGLDAHATLSACAAKVHSRLADAAPPRGMNRDGNGDV